MSTVPSSSPARFGVVGLGVMGRNLALNVADHGFPTALWNREPGWAAELAAASPGKPLVATGALEEFVAALKRPRVILMMIKAGDPVDEMLGRLAPLLEAGDIVIDGGNSRWQDTQRREAAWRAKGLNFVGMGVSGGEEGARHGPSLMPGGSPEAWAALRPILEAIAARSDSGPCVTHVGPDGAGHFLKMVHNGIEYADMQLLAEAYDLLARVAGRRAPELAAIFARWNDGPLGSFLVEITAKVFGVTDPETGQPLVDLVKDQAGQKGTGRWTAEAGLEFGVPIPTIAAAIDARGLSAQKDVRLAASRVLAGPPARAFDGNTEAFVQAVHDALLCAKVCCYAQGLDLVRQGSDAQKWGISLRETARIWKAGCIIRARLLDAIMQAFSGGPEFANLVLAPHFRDLLGRHQPAWRHVVSLAAATGIPVPAFSTALSWYDSLRTARLPQNLTQAQRDAFGAHTYERTDHPERGFVHTSWL